jgi:acyl carrier protein
MSETRETILNMVCEQVGLDEEASKTLRSRGRLDELTAVDSLLMVDLVISLEERFGIRFEPADIDPELVGDITRLAAYVDKAVREKLTPWTR